jgi:cephalosporin hydroxylase
MESAGGPDLNTGDDVVQDFHKLYYTSPQRTWQNTFWMGVHIKKCPLDIWIYQEILFRTRPDLIIECGTSRGGGALFLASMCDLMYCGRVLTIDINKLAGRPSHPRITYLTGSSLASDVVGAVRAALVPGERVMVILDSKHQKDHVLGECRTYGPLVTEGNYLIVEDTNINGNPVRPRFGPGPMEAVEEFLEEAGDRFVVDRECEKFLLTFNPSGYLRRI